MTDFTREWIAEREQMEQAATDGPWHWDTEFTFVDSFHTLFDRNASEVLRGTVSPGNQSVYSKPADAEFIADARTALPAAVAALRAVLGAEGPRATGDHSEFSDGYHAALDACREAIETALRASRDELRHDNG